jgi:GntR family transcriptional repressor for pyruvate dehydrogenase complex
MDRSTATTTATAATAIIAPVRPASACGLVVDQLSRAIHLGRFLAGDKLPPERELAKQLGVSRTTVREAVKVLEGAGLVRSKRGAAGGLSVLEQKTSAASLRKTLTERLQAITEIYDYRLAIECAAARLASVRRDEKDLAELARHLERMAELMVLDIDRNNSEKLAAVSQFMALDSEFHLGIARAARNSYLLAAIEDTRAAMFSPVGAIFRRIGDKSNAYHAAIFTAIESGDAIAAEKAMAAHIQASRDGVESLVHRAVPAKK